MAEQQEDKRYGVSCEKDVSVPPVTRTETAPRALETSQDGKGQTSSQLSIQFQGSQGPVEELKEDGRKCGLLKATDPVKQSISGANWRTKAEGKIRYRLKSLIKIAKVDVPNEVHASNFNVSSVGKANPQGSFECVQQIDSSSGASRLSCPRLIQNEITVRATSYSCVTTRGRMTQAEEESRTRATKSIKPGGPFLVKKAAVKRAPEGIPDVVPLRKRTTPMNPALAIRWSRTNNPVSQRPCRDRVIHLLALRSYEKSELLACLERDGVNQKDKDCLGTILQQVANLNTKDNTYSLKNHLFKDIQKDWPGYNETEKQFLELILATTLNSSDNGNSTTNPKESPRTSNKDSPSTSQKRLSDSSFISSLKKKPRISCVTSQVQASLTGCLPTSGVKEACAVSTDPTLSSEQPDYFIKYTTIVSHEQRQRYEHDFNTEYGEYRSLHARIESTIKRFMKLDERRKLLSPGSEEYEILGKEVLEEYRKVKQSNPNYLNEKRRCEYLHQKLSHIKRLIEEFDQQKAKSRH